MKINKTIKYRESYQQIQDILSSRPKSSNRDDILEWLRYTGLVDNYVKKLEYENIDSETLADEIQDIWLSICEIEQSQWDKLYYQSATAIKAFVSGLIYRQIHSNYSKIYFKYKKPYIYFKHISDESWDVFDNSNIMEPFDDQYTNKENQTDIIKRNIENNNNDVYE